MTKPLFLTDPEKPFIYTSFVSTIDGKIFVQKPGYWPIGSEEDYKRFTFLRAHADIIIDGKNTALAFADRTIDTIHSKKFTAYRKTLKIKRPVCYAVITNSPDQSLYNKLKNSYGFRPLIITKNQDVANKDVDIMPINADISELFSELFHKGYKNIFIDGGPTLIGSLIENNLLDEIFLTISPKIFGTELGVTQTLVERKLFPANSIIPWRIKNLEQVNDEIFIRYAKTR